jgi:hypothetical protein
MGLVDKGEARNDNVKTFENFSFCIASDCVVFGKFGR